MKQLRNNLASRPWSGLGSLAGVWLLLMMTLPIRAHDQHTSSAEMEYNPRTQKLEVSLTVFVDDLELALMRHSERLMSLEKTPASDFDAQIQAYLARSFIVTEANGRAAKIEWLGRELEAEKSESPRVTLFFEVPLIACLSGVSLQHTVFCDLYKDQSNLLHLRQESGSRELLFSKTQPLHLLE